MTRARLLIASDKDSNMRYITGLLIPDPFIWMQVVDGKKTKQYVLVSTLELSRAKQEAKPGINVILMDRVNLKNIEKPVGRRRNLADIAASALHSYGVKEIEVPENTWSIYVDTLREHGFLVKHVSPFVPERITKTPREIAAIKRAGIVTKQAFEHALNILKESTIGRKNVLLYDNKPVTSEFIKNEIEKIFIEHGCASGETIVSCGKHAAQPHNRGSGPLYAGEPIVFDIFPRDLISGYYFDMSRTVIKGTPSKELGKLYDSVHKAQLAGLAAVKPCVKASDVDAACKKMFAKLGYKTTAEEGFIHSTGHGVGMDIHERPGIGSKSDEILRPGMVITVEPGLYYKKLGGVRIEDTIVVTKKGYTNLTNVPKEFVLR